MGNVKKVEEYEVTFLGIENLNLLEVTYDFVLGITSLET